MAKDIAILDILVELLIQGPVIINKVSGWLPLSLMSRISFHQREKLEPIPRLRCLSIASTTSFSSPSLVITGSGLSGFTLEISFGFHKTVLYENVHNLVYLDMVRQFQLNSVLPTSLVILTGRSCTLRSFCYLVRVLSIIKAFLEHCLEFFYRSICLYTWK